MKDDDFQFKMVIAIRNDLSLSKGKIAQHASHAAVEAVEIAKKNQNNLLKSWLAEGQKKVVVQVSSFEDLLAIRQKAEKSNLPYSCIYTNHSLPQFEETLVAVAIGPGLNAIIDKITLNLKLY